jgi:TatD DNase family protein
MKLFDAHTHYSASGTSPSGGEAGVLCCSTGPADWHKVFGLTCGDARVTPAFGVHPWFAASARGAWLEELEALLKSVPSCVGEIGLDSLKGQQGQEEVFNAQLALAARLGRPAVLHCVRAWDKMPAMVSTASLPAFLLHAYGGPADLVPALAAGGGYFSFGSEIDRPEREKLRAALRAVPSDRLLFESEGAGARGLAGVLDAAAQLLGGTAAGLAELTFNNSSRFLRGCGK